MKITSYVKITPDRILSDQKIPEYQGVGSALLVSAFKSLGTGYAKFYKMDTLSRLGFLASEILLMGEKNRFEPREDRAVILMNSSSSVCDDKHYQESISNIQEYFPSPGLFVYTLPNIVTGEIAIRNKYYGETCFYILPQPDPKEIYYIINESFQDNMTKSAMCGWVECKDDNDFEALMLIVEDGNNGPEWNIAELSNLIKDI